MVLLKMHLVISSSLNPVSRSRILARACEQHLSSIGRETQWVDLAELQLPFCDGGAAYGDENVVRLSAQIQSCDSAFIATPVYNYDVNSVLKNAIELTGKNWTGKVVSMMLAAGGSGSYMSAMGLANSLMLDFRCLIIPRFVYATGESFTGDQLADQDIQARIEQLVEETLVVSDALAAD